VLDLKYERTIIEDGEKLHQWQNVTFIEKSPYRPTEESLVCDISPQFRDLYHPEELTYELTLKEPVAVSNLTFFVVTPDMSDFTVQVGNKSGVGKLVYCESVPKDLAAGGFVFIKCKNPINGDKIVLSRSYKIYTYQTADIKNRITVCNLKVNSDG